MTHVRTPPYCPQSDGKLERWNQSIKSNCIQHGVPLCVDDAKHLIGQFVAVTVGKRLCSSLWRLTAKDALEGRSEINWAERDRKREASRVAASTRPTPPLYPNGVHSLSHRNGQRLR